jgi:hypothetical protein
MREINIIYAKSMNDTPISPRLLVRFCIFYVWFDTVQLVATFRTPQLLPAGGDVVIYERISQNTVPESEILVNSR